MMVNGDVLRDLGGEGIAIIHGSEVEEKVGSEELSLDSQNDTWYVLECTSILDLWPHLQGGLPNIDIVEILLNPLIT